RCCSTSTASSPGSRKHSSFWWSRWKLISSGRVHHYPRSSCRHHGNSVSGVKHQKVRAEKKQMVGTGRFELPTPRTPSECSTRLSHVPTEKVTTARNRGNQRSTCLIIASVF